MSNNLSTGFGWTQNTSGLQDTIGPSRPNGSLFKSPWPGNLNNLFNNPPAVSQPPQGVNLPIPIPGAGVGSVNAGTGQWSVPQTNTNPYSLTVQNGTNFTVTGINPNGTINVRRGDGEVFNNIDRATAQKYGTSDSDLARLFPNRGPADVWSYTTNNIRMPERPDRPEAPNYRNVLSDLYLESYNNPMKFYDEYMQGQGGMITEAAARNMAKSGRTGLLPTLQTQALQDYMGNQLPKLRDNLAQGYGQENAYNQLLLQQYSQDLGYGADMYGHEANMYSTQMQNAARMGELYNQARDLEIKQQLGLLDSEIRMLDIDERTQAELFRILGANFAEMSKSDQGALLNDIRVALGVASTEADNLEDLVGGTRASNQPTPQQLADMYAYYERQQRQQQYDY